MPKDDRWSEIKSHATSTDIGSVIDHAMDAIEKENDSLKGVLTKNYSRQELGKTRLGELVTLFTNIEVGSTAVQERDVLGRGYEYFFSKFASAEGKYYDDPFDTFININFREMQIVLDYVTQTRDIDKIVSCSEYMLSKWLGIQINDEQRKNVY